MNKNEGIVSCSKSDKTLLCSNTDAAANPLSEKAAELPRNCVGAWIRAVFSDYYIYNAQFDFQNKNVNVPQDPLSQTSKLFVAFFNILDFIQTFKKKYSYNVTISSPVSKNFTDSHHKTIFTNDEMAITVFSTCNSVKNAVFCSFPWGLEWLVNHESLLSSK